MSDQTAEEPALTTSAVARLFGSYCRGGHMQRDLEMAALDREELERLERRLAQELGDMRGRTYVERQALALAYLRAIVERLIRDRERELGVRGRSA